MRADLPQRAGTAMYGRDTIKDELSKSQSFDLPMELRLRWALHVWKNERRTATHQGMSASIKGYTHRLSGFHPW
jgi:hypothetical protein